MTPTSVTNSLPETPRHDRAAPSQLLPAVVFAALAVLLFLPTLGKPLIQDDFWHFDIVTKGQFLFESKHWTLNLFTFVDGTIEHWRLLQERLGVPWWLEPGMRWNFFRPLAAVTHWIDYNYWPEQTALMHLHSIAWYALLILTLNRLYTSLSLDRPVALLATALFLFDFSNYDNVALLNSRNSLIAVSFCALTILSYHLWRSRDSSGAAMLAPLCLLAALCSTELSVGVLGYLVSYALFLDRGSWSKRTARLIPLALLLVVWWILYQSMGYGSVETGGYVDPAANPTEFLGVLARRMRRLILMEWSGRSATLFLTPAWANQGVRFFSVLTALTLMALAWSRLRVSPGARFWLLGSLLSLLPAVAGIPSPRLLLLGNVGVCVVIAEVLLAGKREWSSGGMHTLKASALILVLAAHVLSQAAAYGVAGVHELSSDGSDADPQTYALPYANLSEDQHLFHMKPPTTKGMAGIALERNYRGLSNAGHNYTLGVPAADLEISRVDPHSLRVKAEYAADARSPFHPRAKILGVGDSVSLGQCRFTVEAFSTRHRLPRQYVMGCSEVLEHENYKWIAFREGKHSVWAPPALGAAAVVLPR